MKYDDLPANDKMASPQTSLPVQRTRMAAERTLVATMRTALSLIGFGFTIFSFLPGIAGARKGLGPLPGDRSWLLPPS
jgi:uncharacterized membrane protein YidH (DUF202 family)